MKYYRSVDWAAKCPFCIVRNYVMLFMMLYNKEFWNVYVTYIRKSIEVNWCFNVINNCLYDSKMQYISCVINTTQWYPKISTEDILYQTWKKNTIQFSIGWHFSFLFKGKKWIPNNLFPINYFTSGHHNLSQYYNRHI